MSHEFRQPGPIFSSQGLSPVQPNSGPEVNLVTPFPGPAERAMGARVPVPPSQTVDIASLAPTPRASVPDLPQAAVTSGVPDPVDPTNTDATVSAAEPTSQGEPPQIQTVNVSPLSRRELVADDEEIQVADLLNGFLRSDWENVQERSVTHQIGDAGLVIDFDSSSHPGQPYVYLNYGLEGSEQEVRLGFTVTRPDTGPLEFENDLRIAATTEEGYGTDALDFFEDTMQVVANSLERGVQVSFVHTDTNIRRWLHSNGYNEISPKEGGTRRLAKLITPREVSMVEVGQQHAPRASSAVPNEPEGTNSQPAEGGGSQIMPIPRESFAPRPDTERPSYQEVLQTARRGDYLRALETSPFIESNVIRAVGEFIERGQFPEGLAAVMAEVERRNIRFDYGDDPLQLTRTDEQGEVMILPTSFLTDTPHPAEQIGELVSRVMLLILERGNQLDAVGRREMYEMDIAYAQSVRRGLRSLPQTERQQVLDIATNIEITARRSIGRLGK